MYIDFQYLSLVFVFVKSNTWLYYGKRKVQLVFLFCGNAYVNSVIYWNLLSQYKILNIFFRLLILGTFTTVIVIIEYVFAIDKYCSTGNQSQLRQVLPSIMIICFVWCWNDWKTLHNVYTYSLSSERLTLFRLFWIFFKLFFYKQKTIWLMMTNLLTVRTSVCFYTCSHMQYDQ